MVFTRSGKYFFHNPKTGQSAWIPPENVLKVLKENFTLTEREMFFDPFYQKEDVDISEGEISRHEHYDAHNIEDISPVIKEKVKVKTKSLDCTAEDEFKLYLLKHSIDPFAPWPTIQSLHATSPQFQAIPSERLRQDLFAEVCPILIEIRREETKKKLDGAKEWWNNILANYKYKMNWLQLLKTKLKGNPKFNLLNEKECEKEFKAVWSV